MNDKAQKHIEILDFLDNYLKKTPIDVIKKEFKEISKIGFEGKSAKDYFENFHKYYESSQQMLPLTRLEVEPNIILSKNMDRYVRINFQDSRYISRYEWKAAQVESIISDYNSFSGFATKSYQEDIKNYNYV